MFGLVVFLKIQGNNVLPRKESVEIENEDSVRSNT